MSDQAGTPKLAAAVELGRLGGRLGGKARAAKLSAEQRHTIAVNAAVARWSNQSERNLKQNEDPNH